MSKASSLAKKFDKISNALQQRYGSYVHEEFDDFIEAMMHQILALGASTELAQQALQAIHAEFVDWNDMRMSSVREVQDIIGDDYPRCREKAEDLINLLADLYTAFRKMKVTEIAPTEEGMQTLRALENTTLIRRDMVEHALNVVYNIPTFPCDEYQFGVLQLLGGMPKDMEYEDAMFEVAQALSEGQIDINDLRQLCHGLRCHTDFLIQHQIFDPKPIGYGWDKEDPLGMKVPAFKSGRKKMEKIDPIKPAPKPRIILDDDDDEEEDLGLEEFTGGKTAVKVVAVDDDGNEISLPDDAIVPLDDPDEPKKSSEEETTKISMPSMLTSIADTAKSATKAEQEAEEATEKESAVEKTPPPTKKAAPKKEAKKAAAKKAAPGKEVKKAGKKAETKKAVKKAAAKKAAPKKEAKKSTKKAAKKAAPKKEAKKAAKKSSAKKSTKKAAKAKKAAPKKEAKTSAKKTGSTKKKSSAKKSSGKKK